MNISINASTPNVNNETQGPHSKQASFSTEYSLSKQEQDGAPQLDKPAPATWPGANTMMSNIGKIMLLLTQVGIALRDQQREQTKIHHDASVLELEKSADLMRDQATTAFVTAAISFAVSVGLSVIGMKAQSKANVKNSEANRASTNLSNSQAAINKIKHQPQPLNRQDTKAITNHQAKQDQLITLQNSAANANFKSTAISQSIMPMGQVVSGIGQGVQSTLQAEQKETEAVGQHHQKASDLASQDYQEMEKLRGSLVSSLKEIVSLMNEAVKTATHV